MRYSGFDKILSEAIIKSMDKCLEEEHVINEATVVNSMATAEKLIEAQWTSPDDTFFIAINQREKDNGGRHSHPSGWYKNGGSHAGCNYIANSIITGATKDECINNFRNCELHLCPPYDKMFNVSSTGIDGIKQICQDCNARAYMTINKRSMSTAEHFAQRDQKRKAQWNGTQVGQLEDRNNPGPNLYKALGKIIRDISVNRNWGLIDCDTEDPQAIKELRDLLNRKGIKIFNETPSHHGVHFWCSTRDAYALNDIMGSRGQIEGFRDFEKYRPANTNRRLGDPMVQYEGDSPILLYSDSSNFY